MAKTKQQLIVENNTQFPNNNTGFISPDKLRSFNVDMIDSMVDELSYGAYTASIAQQSASFDARIDALEGLSGSLSGSTAAIAASVAALSASVLLIQDFTASADERLDDLEAFTSSYNSFSASVDAQFTVYDEEIYNLNVHSQSLNNFTSSVNNKFSTLATTTASLQTQINTLASATSSYAISASVAAVDAAQQSQIDQLTAFTGSIGPAATGSLFASASFTNDTITFTKGDGSTLDVSGFASTGSNTFIGDQTIDTAFKLGVNSIESTADLELNGTRVVSKAELFVDGTFTASLQEGYLYVGNAAGIVSSVPTSSIVTDINTGSLVTTSSFNTYTASVAGRLTNIEATTASLNTSVANLNSFTSSQSGLNSTFTTTASFNAYTSSANGRLTNIESTTASLNTSVANLNTTTASLNTSVANLNTTTASLNTSVTNLNSFTSSANGRLGSLEAKTGSYATTGSNTFVDNQYINTGSGLYTNRVEVNTLGANLELIPYIGQDVIVKGGDLVVEGTFTASLQQGYLYVGNSAGTLQAVPTSSIVTQINTGSLATTGSNYFVGNQLISGSVSVTGSIFLRSGSLSGSVISNLTDTYTSVPAVDYIVTLTSASYAALVSGSLTNPNTMYVVSDIGYTPISTFNSFTSSVNTKFDNVQASTASLNTFTASAAISITNLNSTTASLNTSVTNLNSFTASANTKFDNISISTASLNAFTASAAGRLTNIEATTASLNTSVTNLNSFTASQTNLNGTFATTGSNVFRGTETISGSVDISGSFKINAINYPTGSGVAGYFLQTNGTNQADWNYVKTLYEEVKNGDTVTLPKGTPVFASGSVGNQSIVIAADAGDPTRMPATYVLAQELIVDTEGLGIVIGFINGVDTSAFNEGDEIYVAVGGGFTNVAPTGSALIQPLGIVNRVDASNGSGIVLNPGVSNGLPNIAEGNVWVGNVDGVPTATPTSSFAESTDLSSLNSFTASQEELNLTFATTGSNTFVGGVQRITDGDFFTTSSGLDAALQISASGNLSTSDLFIGYGAVDPLEHSYMDFSTKGAVRIQMQSGTNQGNLSEIAFLCGTGGTVLTQQDTNFIITAQGDNLISNDAADVENPLILHRNVFIQGDPGGYAGTFTASLEEGYVWAGGSGSITHAVPTSSFGGGSTDTGSLLVTASAAGATITFTKGDATTFDVVISAAVPDTGSLVTTASFNSYTASQEALNTTFATTGSNKFNGVQYITDAGEFVTSSASAALFVSASTFGVSDMLIGNYTDVAADNSYIEISTANSAVLMTLQSGQDSGNLSEISLQCGSGGTVIRQQDTTFQIEDNGGPLLQCDAVDPENPLIINRNVNIISDIAGGTFTASLEEGYVWAGGSGSITHAVATSSFGGGGATFPFAGDAQISGSLGITGSISFEDENFYVSGSNSGSFISNITDTYTSSTPIKYITTLDSASYAALASGSTFSPDTLYVVSGALDIPPLGNTTLSGSLTITGSAYGNVNTLSVTSNTASMDMSAANFFVLTLPTGSTTHLDATNVGFGQTVSLLVKQATTATGSLVFSPEFKFPSGSAYTASTTGSAKDIITFVTFDSTTEVFATSVKNLI